MYCLVYFAQGKLPWQGVKANSFEEKCDKILAKKIEYQPETLCRNMPKEFTTIFRQIRSLGFEDKPNYELLKN